MAHDQMQMTIENVYGCPLLHSVTPSPTKGHYIPVTVIMVYAAVHHGLIGVSKLITYQNMVMYYIKMP